MVRAASVLLCVYVHMYLSHALSLSLCVCPLQYMNYLYMCVGVYVRARWCLTHYFYSKWMNLSLSLHFILVFFSLYLYVCVWVWQLFLVVKYVVRIKPFGVNENQLFSLFNGHHHVTVSIMCKGTSMSFGVNMSTVLIGYPNQWQIISLLLDWKS